MNRHQQSHAAKRESPVRLRQHEGERMMREASFLGNEPFNEVRSEETD